MNIKGQLVKRIKDHTARQSMLYLYSEESIKEVLDVRPEIKEIDFVLELQKKDYKPEIKEKNKKYAKRVREAIWEEKARIGGAEIAVIEADPEVEAESEEFDVF